MTRIAAAAFAGFMCLAAAVAVVGLAGAPGDVPGRGVTPTPYPVVCVPR